MLIIHGLSSLCFVGNHVLRLFSTSGFACGPSLLHSNQSMPPAPVCLVLEDDAVMVDRFVDRLQSILDELPRDFHFCSLGYGRPKTAPMVRFSTNVGIPTCLWYLTGYILSKDGADYLLNNLPVRGPVDSWVGFHMIHANWDNVFGQALGIGVHSKPVVEPPSRKDLAKILKFRAFAAVVPLCSQKVASASLSRATTSQRRWRQRDTDVTFSGS
jgi:GR25 family glycosyltransferase involved in LPS biosynthesis